MCANCEAVDRHYSRLKMSKDEALMNHIATCILCKDYGGPSLTDPKCTAGSALEKEVGESDEITN